MIDLECPSCHAPGSVPNDKSHGRLVCRKCHTVFHLTPSGRAVPGEPPTDGYDHSITHSHGHAHDHRHPQKPGSTSDGPGVLKLLGALAALGVLVAGISGAYFALGPKPGDNLNEKGLAAAKAVSTEDLATLKGLVKTDTMDDFTTWYTSIRSLIEQMKKTSLSHEVKTTILVIEGNDMNKKGEVMFFFAPAKGVSRNEEIALQAGTENMQTREFFTYWALDDGGKWRIDGRQTNQHYQSTKR